MRYTRDSTGNSFWVDEKEVEESPPFFAGHLLLTVLGIVGTTVMGEGMELRIIAAVIVAFSAFLRMGPDWPVLEEPGYFYLILQVFCCILNWNYERPKMMWNLNLLAFFAALILKVFYDNLKWTDKFIQSKVSTTHLDERRLKQLNFRISFIYAGGVGILLMLSGLIPVSISPIIRALGRLFAMFTSGISGEVLPELEEEKEEVEEIIQRQPPMEIPDFVKFIEKFIEYFGIILIIVGVIVFIIFLIKTVRSHYYRKQQAAVTGDEAIKDVVEQLDRRRKISKSGQKQKISVFERNLVMRIRRIYARTIKRLKTEEDMGMLCPKEQVEYLGKQRNMDAEQQQEIVRLYEKARYANATVTEQDTKQMNQLIK